MIKVLFVCLGNICRSPMAEAIFRSKVKEHKLDHSIQVDSAGTGDWHIGAPPHQGTRSILDIHKISYEGMKARQVLKADANEFTYIVAMDEQNKQDLMALFGEDKSNTVIKLLDYDSQSIVKDVPDPYFTGNFEEVYEMVDRSCTVLLEEIKREHKI
ncbi:low molecular weight protein-tyrosine-phosphatase [Bacillus horti]|uniref:protein-tyrosine-phosphatase n=1 Tax=Caldalkalibacillus horti TaxID=77523 RepID=A0ABT9W2G1_9BACI|nr:low molecular weight protein-tyrosine-phosphatase [Bacillus horti]MDQ0167442.1 protein-tyrosine phosphatase [Bacillus horti]